MSTNRRGDNEEIRCSFCGKLQSQVSKIIAGQDVYICNECIDISKNWLMKS